MGDLIDRQEAINAVTQFAEECWANYRGFVNLSGTIDAIEKVPSSPRWVRCEEELPKKGEIVIVSDGKRTWDVGQYRCLLSDDRTKWWWKGHTIKTVKWWMRKKDALPEPPKEGE